MPNSVYTALTRQQGLAHELQVVANNLANASTTGYKSDRAIFAEFLVDTGTSADESISMGRLAGHSFQMEQGGLNFTGGPLDLAIQGDGFFQVDAPQGQRLTRAGHFLISPDGVLIDNQGNAVLSTGGNPIILPADAGDIKIGSDGSISANGQLLDQISIVVPQGPLQRDSNTYFSTAAQTELAQGANVVQGALEQSNVLPVLEMARMIEVQRAYEAGQAMMDREDERIGQLINSLRER